MSVSSVLSVAVSGLNASAERFSVAANNIVNANSDGYQALHATTVSQTAGSGPGASPGGVRNVITQGGTVDLAHKIVDSIFARISYSANAQVIRTADQTLGQLLDIRA